MDGQNTTATLIRKLRKKLRQIENLQRTDRDLTDEEQNKVDSKEDIRSELKDLLTVEEEAMVELSKKIGLSAIEEKRIQEKLVENVISREYEEDNHQVPNPANNLSELDQDDEVVLTSESDREVDPSETPEKAVSYHDDDTGKSGEIMDVQRTHSEAPTVGGDGNTPSATPSEQQQQPRRSTRIKKQQRTTNNGNVFANMELKTRLLEGHHHDVCSVDMHGKYVISAGRDTSLKLWDSSTMEELQSFGGHESTVTKVLFLKDRAYEGDVPNVLTASTDCSVRLWSMEQGKVVHSIYVYNTITCMDYKNGKALIGTDGGKMEVYDIESRAQSFSMNVYDGVSVTAVKFLDASTAVCASSTGELKIYNTLSTTITDQPNNEDATTTASPQPIFTLDHGSITVSSKREDSSATTTINPQQHLNPSKINCMAVYEGLVIYGDNGFNIKVLDHKKGQLTKVRNNLKEFCPTEALYIGHYQSKQCLFSVGSDVDSGDSYINIRSLPNFNYLGTVRDSESNSGSVTAICEQEIEDKLHFVTGGSQLRVWNQVAPTNRGKKRKNSPNGDCTTYVPCKYICNFTDPRDSEPESDVETESEGGTGNRGEHNVERIAAGSVSGGGSWCTIL